MAETAQLTVQLDLRGNLTSGITKAQRQLDGLARSAGRVGKGVGQVGAGFARAGLLVGGAAVAGLTAAAKAGIDFEDAFAGVRKTVNETDLTKAGLSFEKLSTAFRTMATEIPIAAVDFAKLGETAGALGIKAQDIEEFVRVTAMLGVTTDLTADQAADSLGRIGTILKFTGDDYENFADSLVALGNAGASVESEIIEISKRFAAEGKAAGLATEEIAGLASATASLGFAPERGGTALSRVFANMSTNIALANDKGKAFARTTGRSIIDLQKALDRGDGLEIFQDFLKGLKGLSATDAARVLKAAGITNVSDRTIFRTMADNLPFVNEQLEIAKNATGALLEEATKKFATTASKIQLFKNNLIEAGITLSEGFLPAVGRSLDKLSAAFKDPGTKGEIKKLGEEIGAALDDIDWPKVIAGAKDFVGVLKSTLSITLSILETLNKLPTEIKAAAAALLVLNKASGGLIGAGVGNIAGGIAETAIRGLGSKLPKVGSLFAQPVFVTNWPLGGIGGGLGGAAGAAGAVGWGASIAGALSVAAPAIGVALASNFATEVANKELGTNFLAPGTGGVGPMAIVAAIHNLGEVIKFGQPKPPAPIVNVTVDNRGHEGAGFRPKPAGAPANPFARPDRDDAVKAAINNTTTAVETMKGNIGFKVDKVASGVISAGVMAKNSNLETKATVASGTMIQAALMGSQIATTLTSAYGTQGAVRSVAPPIVGAIRANRPITTVTVNVTATHVTKSTTIQNRYGSGGGSGSQNARPGDSGV